MHTQIDVAVDEVGLQTHRMPVVLERLLKIGFLFEDVAEI